ncbi:hypothetical protein Clacol_005547 [Clathrus columnatus]|uniref:Vacuolar protein sorting-associated protein 9a n=1 Tax=Clathrus columnatus TaxID=1419009 RepID=A0AAV5AEI9_9AGAM|nr:hypothetical protein Clacol_005547 [Clathrus columnatus]
MQEEETKVEATLASSNEFNPWSSESNIPPTATATATVDLATLAHDSNIETEENMDKPSIASTNTLVLKEFDPLATSSLNEAQGAWAAAAEGHTPIESSLETSETKESLEPPSQKPTQIPLTALQSAPAFISSIPSSLATFAKNLTISPKRSVTPPLPPPPRTSSLRHNHHSSLPVNVLPSLDTNANLPRSSSQEAIQSITSSNERNVHQSKLDGSFDFQKFLDQMKSRSADPIAKYLRSFLSNFAKKTYPVKDQIKIINDFLDFIADKMRNLEGSPWQHATQQEFDHALDAMEKLVMNRLYEFTFQPLLPPGSRTTDDIERDHVLQQRILLFGWLTPEHLDIPFKDPNQSEERGFLEFAQQDLSTVVLYLELLKVNHYKAPRDKLICILNCCKVIFGLIRHLKLSEGADSFLPILIYVVLKANPDYLLSNVEYINRFRRQDRLQSEAGYYLSSLMGAVSFIETMDHTALSNISQDEFERNVELAIEDLSVDDRVPTPPSAAPSTSQAKLPSNSNASVRPSVSLVGEEAARPLSLPMPDHSSGTIESSQLSLAEDTRRFFQKTSDTISKPLTAIGRIFSEMLDDQRASRSGIEAVNVDRLKQTPSIAIPSDPSSPIHTPGDVSHQAQAQIQTPYKPRVRPAHLGSLNRLSNSSLDYTHLNRGLIPQNQQVLPQPRGSTPSPLPSRTASPSAGLLYAGASTPQSSRIPTPTLDFSALQDEIERAHTAAQNAARETLKQIFPSVETEVADMVLEANNGDLGGSIEALLEISGQQQQNAS